MTTMTADFDTITATDFNHVFAITEDGKALDAPAHLSTPYLDDVELNHDDNGALTIDNIPKSWELVRGLSVQSRGTHADGVLESCEIVTEVTMSGLYDADSANTFVMVVPRDGDLHTGNAWDTCECPADDCMCDPFIMNYVVLRHVG